MKRKVLTFLCVSLAVFAHSKVTINEFQSGNKSTIADPEFNEYSDWIELYNDSSAAVDLSGFYLTNKLSDTTRWKFPAGTTIAAGGYLIIWADDKSTGEHTVGLHTNFKLNTKSDEIAIFSNNKKMVDSYKFGVIQPDVSVGRKKNNTDVWALFNIPTPGLSNTSTSYMTQAQQPVMSVESGFYSTNQTVALSVPLQKATIRYTTNGTNPTASSPIYTDPISILRNTVLKAVTFHPDYLASRIVTQTYFIGERDITLPVVSIGVDSLSMFDEVTGMYSLGPYASKLEPNYGANFWEDWKLPATFEYFVNGKQKVQVNAGISIHGGWSRRFDQRSFAIECGNAYGDERMEYQFFKDKDITEFKDIILKNAGSDVSQLKYRDGMITSLVRANMNVDYQAYQPSSVFVNGRYWGILNVREKLTDDYLKNNYNLDSSEVDLLYNYKEVYAGSSESFESIYSYIENYDPSNAAVYQHIQSVVDIDEFIDYQIAEIFVSNNDWPGYNIRYWKKKGDGNKWRWIMYDCDQSFAYYTDANEKVNSLENATTEYGSGWPNPSNSTLILRNLLYNTTFKNLFVQRFAAHMNSTFHTDSMKNMVSRIEKLLDGEKQAHLARWGYNDSLWTIDYNNIINFAERRPALMRGFIKDYFGISSTKLLTLKAMNNNSPRFKLDGVNLKGNNITGEYFNGIPFTLEAMDENGLSFVEWQNGSGKMVSKSHSINVSFNSDMTFVAVYEENPGIQNVFINEFMASNNTSARDSAGEFEDWIELYNANDYAVDLAGSYITDDLTNPCKFLFVSGASDRTTIPANGYLLVWADEETFQGPLHTNFKLSASGESIGLCQQINNEVYWIDSLSYRAQSTDISFGRKTDGNDILMVITPSSPNATNGTSNGTGNNPDITNNTQNAITVYPAITRDVLNITQLISEPMNVTIYSILGEVVINKNFKNNTKASIYLNNLAKGVYIVKVKSDTTTIEKRVFVQ